MRIVNGMIYKKFRKQLNSPYKLFTLCYGIFALAMIAVNWANGYISIGGTDGVGQHYVAMQYIANLYRNIAANLLHGKFELPMYDMSIGMGDDILTTLNYYGLGDSFYLIIAFVPDAALPYFFTFFFYFRLYLGGMCAILFMERLLPQKNSLAYTVAAMLYCCSGFALEANVHIIFVHAMMYLPLILWAVEGCLKDSPKSRLWLIVGVAGLALTGFYYLYIIGITAGLYALYRWTVYYRFQGIKFQKLVEIGIACLLSVGLAGVVFVPEFMAFAGDNRNAGSGEFVLTLFNDWEETKRQYYRLFYVTDTIRGMASIAVCGLVSMIVVLASKHHKQAKIFIIAGFICYNLPVVKWIMSGARSSIYNRWEIILALMFASMTVVAWDELWQLSGAQIAAVICGYILVVGIGIVDKTFTERCYRNSILAYTIYLIFLLGVQLKPFCNKKLFGYCVEMLALFSIALTWYTTVINYPIYSLYAADKSDILDGLDIASWCRIEDGDGTINKNNAANRSMIEGYSTTTEYFSIDNSGYKAAREALGLGNSYYIAGLDKRSILESLAGVRYLLTDDDTKGVAAYGYELLLEKETEALNSDVRNIYVFENKDALPIMYVYDNLVDYDEYAGLNQIERQLSMLNGIALEGTLSDNPINVEKDRITENTFTASVSDDIYNITCNCKGGCESYLYLEIEDDACVDYVKVGDAIKHYYYSGIRWINLGYHEENETIEVNVSSSVELDENNLHVMEMDMQGVDSKLESLADSGVLDTTIATNKITANVVRDAEGWLCLSLPHTEGWEAYVDGVRTQIYTANDLFMGIYIPEGEHTVEFRYTTPGIKMGMVVSVVCLAVLIIIGKSKKIGSYPHAQ